MKTYKFTLSVAPKNSSIFIGWFKLYAQNKFTHYILIPAHMGGTNGTRQALVGALFKRLNKNLWNVASTPKKAYKFPSKSIENLSNDDGDGNENVISKYKFALL